MIISPLPGYHPNQAEEHRVRTAHGQASLYRPSQKQIRLANDRLSLIESSCSRWSLLSATSFGGAGVPFAGTSTNAAAFRSIDDDLRDHRPLIKRSSCRIRFLPSSSSPSPSLFLSLNDRRLKDRQKGELPSDWREVDFE